MADENTPRHIDGTHNPEPNGGSSQRGLDRRDLLKMGALGLGALSAGAAGVAACGTSEGTPSTGSGQGAGGASNTDRGAALGAAPAQPLAAPPMDVVRVGFVGAGGMGSVHIRNLLAIEGAELTAVCDIREEHAVRAADWAEEAGQRRPTLYTNGETDFERMCAEEELDVVYTATPWRWHVPVMVAAMQNGKHAVTEVPAAMTLEDCWQLVELSESLEKHCVMMENVNYGRSELLCLNLVRNGLLGEVLHTEGGYLHDLREIKFADEGEGCGAGSGQRRKTRTSIQPMASGPSPTASISIEVTNSPAWCRFPVRRWACRTMPGPTTPRVTPSGRRRTHLVT